MHLEGCSIDRCPFPQPLQLSGLRAETCSSLWFSDLYPIPYVNRWKSWNAHRAFDMWHYVLPWTEKFWQLPWKQLSRLKAWSAPSMNQPQARRSCKKRYSHLMRIRATYVSDYRGALSSPDVCVISYMIVCLYTAKWHRQTQQCI